MVDATYVELAKAIKPGVQGKRVGGDRQLSSLQIGSERVQCVNSVSGARGKPHCHTFSDRMIQPGDIVYLA